MPIKKAIVSVLLALTFLEMQGCGVFLPSTLKLNEKQLQERIERKFPAQHAYFPGITLKFTNPVVRLRDGTDRINFLVDVALNLLTKDALNGTGEISGKVRYDQEKGQFYLDDARVEDLSVDGIPANFEQRVVEIANTIAREYITIIPVHTLDQSLKQSLVKRHLHSAEVQNGHLVLHFNK